MNHALATETAADRSNGVIEYIERLKQENTRLHRQIDALEKEVTLYKQAFNEKARQVKEIKKVLGGAAE